MADVQPTDLQNDTTVTSTDVFLFQDGSTAEVKNVLFGDMVGAAWIPWIPTWTNLGVGSSIVNARYTIIGKTVKYRLSVILGGVNVPVGSVSFSLPVASITYPGTATVQVVGDGAFNDSGAVVYAAKAVWTTTTTATLIAQPASGAYLFLAAINGSVPFTWGVGDEIFIQGEYEAA